MTGPTDMTHTPQILIDEWPDGWIENTAWVEITTEVSTPEKAVELIESLYPADDREEHESYACDGETTWQKPDPKELFKARLAGHGYDEGPWVEAEEGEDTALKFWVVKVVCPA